MKKFWPFQNGNTEIWYQKPEFFRDGVMGVKWLKKQGMMPTKKTLSETHVCLGTMRETNLETIFAMMQGERWSPNGESRSTILDNGLKHTSMVTGDVIVVDGQAHIADWMGFAEFR